MINIPTSVAAPLQLGGSPQAIPPVQPAQAAPQYNAPPQPSMPSQMQTPPTQTPNFQQTLQQAQAPQPRQFNTTNTGVVLQKGQKVSLTKMNPNLDEISVGLGWDVTNGLAYDLDTEAFMLDANDRIVGDSWFVFYNQPISPDGSVRHLGDNRTGAGSGDDEVIEVKLSQVSPQVNKIVFVVTINEAKQRGYNFSNIQNAYIRVVDKQTKQELVRFNLSEYYKEVTSMMVGELYNKGNEWRFNPIGAGKNADLMELCQLYGVNIVG